MEQKFDRLEIITLKELMTGPTGAYRFILTDKNGKRPVTVLIMWRTDARIHSATKWTTLVGEANRRTSYDLPVVFIAHGNNL